MRRTEILLRDALLYVWSNAVLRGADDRSKVPSGAVHAAVASISSEIEALGVPLLFDAGPGYPHSRQVDRALDDITPFGVRYENPAFYVVLERDRASRHVTNLRQRLPEYAMTELDGLIDRFQLELRRASDTLAQ